MSNVMPGRWVSNIAPLPRWRGFMRDQELFIFIGLVLSAAMWALRVPISFASVMVFSICIGNVLRFVTIRVRPLYAGRRAPWNWLVFLPLLAIISLIGTFLATSILYFSKQWSLSYLDIFRAAGPFSVLVCMVVGTISYLMESLQSRLKETNAQLQTALDTEMVAHEKQQQELQRARQIQQDLLPKSVPQVQGLQVAGAWQPATSVGGDYYDVVPLGEDRIGICIGDVAGKGITAALLMANLQAAFRAFATADASPAAVCAKLNTFLCGNMATGKFISFFYAVVDARTLTITYENAGHCPALLVRHSGETLRLCGDGAVLGVLPDWVYADSQVKLETADRLVLFTDGVVEAENRQGDEFGEERLVRAVECSGDRAEDIREKLMKAVDHHCGGAFRDDATCVVAVVR